MTTSLTYPAQTILQTYGGDLALMLLGPFAKNVDEKRGGVAFPQETPQGHRVTVKVVNNFWDYFDVFITVDGHDKPSVRLTEDDDVNPQTLATAWNLHETVNEMLATVDDLFPARDAAEWLAEDDGDGPYHIDDPRSHG